jgi:phage-related protein
MDGHHQQLVFVASALNDLRAFPGDVRAVIGFALYKAQRGGKHLSAKPLKGFKGAGGLRPARLPEEVHTRYRDSEA